MKTLIAYVDGSYCNKQKAYSSGVVFLEGEKIIEQHSFAGNESSLVSMRNVSGEIKGAEYAMRWAVLKGYKKLILHYDYEGIEKWCNGQWKAKKQGTQDYSFMYGVLKRTLDVEFVKVKAHSGDIYNELADRLAKNALNIK